MMRKNWKESKFFTKLKSLRINRAVYLSTGVVVLSLAIILTVTAVNNRSKKHGLPETTLPSESTNAPVTEDTPTGGTPSVPSDALPDFALPVEGKLAKAHSSELQVFSQTMQDFRVHLGVDIATEEAAEVFASADGTVKKIWEDPMMGWCVALEHSGNCVTVYKNLAKTLAEGLSEGLEVRQGQLLGTVGDTALLEIADEPHLHMEMTVNGKQVNPLSQFSDAEIAVLSKDTAFEKPENQGKA